MQPKNTSSDVKKPDSPIKSNLFSLALCVGSFVVMFIYLLLVDSFRNVLAVLKMADPLWLFIAVACIIAYWFLDGLVLHMALKPVHPSQKFAVSLRVAIIGQYFNAITPLASGGEPAQAYFLVKRGAPLGQAMSALLAKFIVYQTTLTLVSIFALVMRYSFFMERVSSLMIAVLIGFIGNTAITFGLIGIAVFRKGTAKAAGAIVDFLAFIHIIRKPEQKKEYILRELENFHDQFRFFAKHKLHLVKLMVVTLVQLLFFFLIGNAIYNSFRLHGVDSITLLSSQAFVHMVSAFAPTPGAIGAAEGSFAVFFSLFFPKKMISLAVVLWRLITFYLSIVVGLLFTVLEKHFTTNEPLEETPVVDDLLETGGVPQYPPAFHLLALQGSDTDVRKSVKAAIGKGKLGVRQNIPHGVTFRIKDRAFRQLLLARMRCVTKESRYCSSGR